MKLGEVRRGDVISVKYGQDRFKRIYLVVKHCKIDFSRSLNTSNSHFIECVPLRFYDNKSWDTIFHLHFIENYENYKIIKGNKRTKAIVNLTVWKSISRKRYGTS